MLCKRYIYKYLLGFIAVDIVSRLVINNIAIKFEVGTGVGYTGVIVVVN